MKNVIISYNKLPNNVRQEVETKFPHGFDHVTFEFEHPQKPVIYTAIQIMLDGKKYLIKLDQKEKIIDQWEDEE